MLKIGLDNIYSIFEILSSGVGFEQTMNFLMYLINKSEVRGENIMLELLG